MGHQKIKYKNYVDKMNSKSRFLYEKAIQSLNSNNFERAKSILLKILDAEPNNFEANQTIGVILGIENNHQEAYKYFLIAQKLRPHDFYINLNLGKALSEQAMEREALKYYSIAAQINPNNHEVYLNYGKSLLELDQDNEAINYFKKSIEIKKDYAEAFYNLGLALCKTKKNSEALKCFDAAIKNKPNLAEAWFKKGDEISKNGSNKEGLLYLNKAIQLKPDYIQALIRRGQIHGELGSPEEALDDFTRVILYEPNLFEVYAERGIIFYQLNLYDEAIADFKYVISNRPDIAEVWSNMGMVQSQKRDYDEAIISLNKAIELNPDYSEAWSNMGASLTDQKIYDQAISCFNKAIEIKFDNNDAHLGKGVLSLHLKNYELGWNDYEFRIQNTNKEFKQSTEKLKIWDGIEECGHLAIIAEQGIGDSIFFSSLLPVIKSRLKNITVLIDKRLIKIFSRSFNGINFLDINETLSYEKFDAQILFGSLAVILGMNPKMPDRYTPYIVSNENSVNEIKEIFTSNKKIKCGVAWKSANPKHKKNKSISLSDLKPIFLLDNCEMINLQHGEVELEIKSLEDSNTSKIRTIKNIDLFQDIDGVLSIVEACDCIITTSNVIAHLAGAIGKHTFLLVPYSPGRLWYWHDEKISSWYPSISLHTQQKNFEWYRPIEEITMNLKNLILEYSGAK